MYYLFGPNKRSMLSRTAIMLKLLEVESDSENFKEFMVRVYV